MDSNDLVWRNDTSGNFVVWYLDAAGNRTFGTLTSPPSPSLTLDEAAEAELPTAPLDWIIVGPR